MAVVNGRRLLILAAVAWCALFAALEGYRTVKLFLNRPWSDEQPSLWRLGSDPVIRLRDFTEQVDARLPASTRLAFSSPLTGEERHILHMWVAYLLPRHDIVPEGAPGSEGARYWLTYGAGELAPPPPARLPLLLTVEQGSLFGPGPVAPLAEPSP